MVIPHSQYLACSHQVTSVTTSFKKKEANIKLERHVTASNIFGTATFLLNATEVAMDLTLWALRAGPSVAPRTPYLEIKSHKKNEIPFLDICLDKLEGDKKRPLGLD